MLKVETGAMEELITNAVDTAIQQQIATAIDQLILNDEWIKKIEGLVNVNISQKIERQLSNIDLQSLLAENIDVSSASNLLMFSNWSGSWNTTA